MSAPQTLDALHSQLQQRHLALCEESASEHYYSLLKAQTRLPNLHLQTPDHKAAYRFSYDGEQLQVNPSG
ncbi:MAG: hypothetical protein ACI9OO_001077, partial [Bacteroidia bacterium]